MSNVNTRAGPCSDPTSNMIWGILNQRRQINAFAVAPPRLTLSTPYPTYTKMQLDMRRKVEILKYQGQNSQSNNRSNAQKWSQLASGRSSSLSQYAIENNGSSTDLNNSNCPANHLIPTLTSACDVPGPPIYLTNDPSVPLYKYIVDRTYSILPNEIVPDFNTYTINELFQVQSAALNISTDYNKTSEIQLGSLIVNNPSLSPVTYSINTPLAIWCVGVNVGKNYNQDTKKYDPRPTIAPIVISIASIYLHVYYNNVEVYDPINIPFSLSPLIVDVSNTEPQVFYAIQYVGIANLQLTLLSTFSSIYNLSLTVNYNYDNAAKLISAFDAGVFCNLSEVNQHIFANPTPITGPNNVITVSTHLTPYANSFINYTNLVNALPI